MESSTGFLKVAQMEKKAEDGTNVMLAISSRARTDDKECSSRQKVPGGSFFEEIIATMVTGINGQRSIWFQICHEPWSVVRNPSSLIE